MSILEGGLSVLNRRSEKLALMLYFGLIVALTPFLASMLGAAWEVAHLSRLVIDARRLLGLGLGPVTVFGFGAFLGLMILLTLDPKKRWQAILLWIGTVVALAGLASMGLFLPNIAFLQNLLWLGVGLVVGIILGGGRRLLEPQTARALEFRPAARNLFLLLTVIVIAAVLELHIEYPEFVSITASSIDIEPVNPDELGVQTAGLAQHMLVAVTFVVVLKRFVEYDSEEEFFVLGPEASGKSLLLVGAYLEALNRGKDESGLMQTPLEPSRDLAEVIELLDRDRSGWIVEATAAGEIRQLAFQYVHGTVFPKNVRLSSLDYAGEYLQLLPDVLTGAVVSEDLDNTVVTLADEIEQADTLLFVVDVERFVNNEPLDISDYFSILQACRDKRSMIVATKADLFVDDFYEQIGIEPHLAFDEFRTFVEDRLRQSEQVDGLLRQCAGTTIHPVYYQTTENEDGRRVPMRDSSDAVITIGFDELLNELGR